jgi:uncharacterized protein YndB with AHSA1/START domain
MAVDTSVITPKRGRTAVIVAEASIQRSPEEVFDYCSDHTHEPEWNSKMKDVAKLTDTPIGVGTRYRMQFTSAPAVISECVRFERPSVWEMVGRSRAMTFGWRGRMRPELERDIATIKARLEGAGPPPPGPAAGAPSR